MKSKQYMKYDFESIYTIVVLLAFHDNLWEVYMTSFSSITFLNINYKIYIYSTHL